MPYAKLQQAATSPQAASALLKAMEQAYDLDECESVLIKDAVEYELDYFRLGSNSEAAKPATEAMLTQYAETLSRSLTSSFSRDDDRAFPVTIYAGECPMLAVTVQLKPSTDRTIKVKAASDELLSVLCKMDIALLEKQNSGLYVRRDAHVYQGRYVHIAKRNQRRLWSRSAALRDADDVYADIMNSWGKD